MSVSFTRGDIVFRDRRLVWVGEWKPGLLKGRRSADCPIFFGIPTVVRNAGKEGKRQPGEVGFFVGLSSPPVWFHPPPSVNLSWPHFEDSGGTYGRWARRCDLGQHGPLLWLASS